MDPTAHELKLGLTVLATRQGAVVYPPKPPAFASEPAWARIFAQSSWEPFVTDATLAHEKRVLAGDAVPATDLVLLSVAREDDLFAPARSRLTTRLTLGLVTALLPIGLLVLLLRRTLRVFSETQEEAARDERLRMLGEAANLIAHEIKNTLNGLQMGVDVVLRQEPGAKERASVTALRGEVRRLSEFTTELLTFSKGVVPRPGPMDLAGFVRKLSELSQEQATEAAVALIVEIPEERIEIRADSSLIHVVLSNLMSNAFDAGAKGIKVAVGRNWVRVSDDGPGVPDTLKETLFEPFVTGKPSGVGIGLALSRKIARAHGGDLVLEPTAKGASFLLTLPEGVAA
jgi:two-component system C4-dicarboxylate transport sensor histidine kinase DctB